MAQKEDKKIGELKRQIENALPEDLKNAVEISYQKGDKKPTLHVMTTKTTRESLVEVTAINEVRKDILAAILSMPVALKTTTGGEVPVKGMMSVFREMREMLEKGE